MCVKICLMNLSKFEPIGWTLFRFNGRYIASTIGAVRTTAASKDDQVPSLLEGLSGWDGTQGTMYTGQDTI